MSSQGQRSPGTCDRQLMPPPGRPPFRRLRRRLSSSDPSSSRRTPRSQNASISGAVNRSIQAIQESLDEQEAAENVAVRNCLQNLQDSRRDFVMAVANVSGNVVQRSLDGDLDRTQPLAPDVNLGYNDFEEGQQLRRTRNFCEYPDEDEIAGMPLQRTKRFRGYGEFQEQNPQYRGFADEIDRQIQRTKRFHGPPAPDDPDDIAGRGLERTSNFCGPRY